MIIVVGLQSPQKQMQRSGMSVTFISYCNKRFLENSKEKSWKKNHGKQMYMIMGREKLNPNRRKSRAESGWLTILAAIFSDGR